jgi:hypothetical protein
LAGAVAQVEVKEAQRGSWPHALLPPVLSSEPQQPKAILIPSPHGTWYRPGTEQRCMELCILERRRVSDRTQIFIWASLMPEGTEDNV